MYNSKYCISGRAGKIAFSISRWTYQFGKQCSWLRKPCFVRKHHLQKPLHSLDHLKCNLWNTLGLWSIEFHGKPRNYRSSLTSKMIEHHIKVQAQQLNSRCNHLVVMKRNREYPEFMNDPSKPEVNGCLQHRRIFLSRLWQ